MYAHSTVLNKYVTRIRIDCRSLCARPPGVHYPTGNLYNPQPSGSDPPRHTRHPWHPSGASLHQYCLGGCLFVGNPLLFHSVDPTDSHSMFDFRSGLSQLVADALSGFLFGNTCFSSFSGRLKPPMAGNPVGLPLPGPLAPQLLSIS